MTPAAQVLVGVGFVIFAVAILLLIWRRGLDRVAVRFGPVSAEVDAVKKINEIHKDVKQINTAVNHVEDGEPPMIERVRKMEGEMGEVRKHLTLVVEHLGIDVE